MRVFWCKVYGKVFNGNLFHGVKLNATNFGWKFSPGSTISAQNRLFSYSCTAAQKARDRETEILRKYSHFLQYESVFQEKHELPSEKWEEIMQHGLQKSSNTEQCITNIMKECRSSNNLKLASSFLLYLKEISHEPTTGCLALFMDICSQSQEECDEATILSTYDELSKRVPVQSMPLLVRMIGALCRTSHWQQSHQLLQTIKKIGIVPSEVYENMTVAAFCSGDTKNAWQLLCQLMNTQSKKFQRVVLAFANYCTTLEKEDRKTAVIRFLQLLHKWQVFLDLESLGPLSDLLKEVGWDVTMTTVNTYSGRCRSCGNIMDFSPISPDTFTSLRKAFLEKVLKRGDIYVNSSPEEWQHFDRLLTVHAPFTHILDGLNIAYRSSGPAHQRSKMLQQNRRMAANLLSIVEQIISDHPSAKLLIVCRAHMAKWHLPTMSRLHDLAHCHYLTDLSGDDSFILYAALYSGIDCKIITSDQLRNHASRLQDAELQRVFKLWQQRAQQATKFAHPIQLQPPRKFTTTSQPCRSDGLSWHIPYNDGSLETSYDLPRTWLCARHVSRSKSLDELHVSRSKASSARHVSRSDDLSVGARHATGGDMDEYGLASSGLPHLNSRNCSIMEDEANEPIAHVDEKYSSARRVQSNRVLKEKPHSVFDKSIVERKTSAGITSLKDQFPVVKKNYRKTGVKGENSLDAETGSYVVKKGSRKTNDKTDYLHDGDLKQPNTQSSDTKKNPRNIKKKKEKETPDEFDDAKKAALKNKLNNLLRGL
ncbi:mitochondrial ribonuclease P catalytic subunit isoform X2 [Hyalella azteca]|uniref:ribonuclease P n=1 Tax=Hyalella azteca TaxID=294128 RepID=A0A979FVD4_HYAAZ|nr:mitochondrial ribonuclease P catalytic subunit isoform X2 [Hyalella azteca]